MGKERHAAILVERNQVVPDLVGVAGEIIAPGFLLLFDLLCPDRVAGALRLAEGGVLERDLQARVAAVSIEDLQDRDVQGRDEGHDGIVRQRIAQSDGARRRQILDDAIGKRTNLAVVFLRFLGADRLSVD